MMRMSLRYKIQGVITILFACCLVFYFLPDHQETPDTTWNPKPLPLRYKNRRLPFHQVYESRQVSFQGYNKTLTDIPQKDKLLLLWTPWNKQWNTINYYALKTGRTSFTTYNCPNTKCFVSRNKTNQTIEQADAILFHLLDTQVEEMPLYRNPNQIWIIYNMEAPWLLNKNLQQFDGLFNWTMSYRLDSDVLIKYGFIGEAKGLDFETKHLNLQNKKPVVWFASDCRTNSRRENYIQELARYIEVDIYGKCGNRRCFPAQSDYCYKKVLERYAFYLSFENSICRDYVTEKFFNAFNYDVVPVVFGGANYASLAPPDSFIDATKYQHPEDLANFLKYLINNPAEYLRYFQWKKSHRAYLHPWMCYLCDKLHQPIVHRVYYDFKKWWIDEAYCREWVAEEGFVAV